MFVLSGRRQRRLSRKAGRRLAGFGTLLRVPQASEKLCLGRAGDDFPLQQSRLHPLAGRLLEIRGRRRRRGAPRLAGLRHGTSGPPPPGGGGAESRAPEPRGRRCRPAWPAPRRCPRGCGGRIIGGARQSWPRTRLGRPPGAPFILGRGLIKGENKTYLLIGAWF